MRTLLGETFAPVTTSVGFLKVGLDVASDALAQWSRSHVPRVAIEELDRGFPEVLHALEPLTGGVRPRELLVEVSGGWTAYFDCGIQGTDAVSTVGYLAEAIKCQGLVIVTEPHTIGSPKVRRGRHGSVQFQMFGPDQTDFLNYVRTLTVAYDGTRWVFIASGAVQPFEEVERYKARRVRDRFDSETLERYCRAVGVDVFNANAYGPRSVLVRSSLEVPTGGLVMSLKRSPGLVGHRAWNGRPIAGLTMA